MKSDYYHAFEAGTDARRVIGDSWPDPESAAASGPPGAGVARVDMAHELRMDSRAFDLIAHLMPEAAA